MDLLRLTLSTLQSSDWFRLCSNLTPTSLNLTPTRLGLVRFVSDLFCCVPTWLAFDCDCELSVATAAATATATVIRCGRERSLCDCEPRLCSLLIAPTLFLYVRDYLVSTGRFERPALDRVSVIYYCSGTSATVLDLFCYLTLFIIMALLPPSFAEVQQFQQYRAFLATIQGDSIQASAMTTTLSGLCSPSPTGLQGCPIPHGPHQIYNLGLYISLAHPLSRSLSRRRPWLAPARPVDPRRRLIKPFEHRLKLIEPRQRLIEPRRRLIRPVEYSRRLIEPRRRLIEPRQSQIEPHQSQIEPCRRLIEPRRRLIEPVEPRRASEEDWDALPSCLGRVSVALLPQKRRFADLRKKRHPPLAIPATKTKTHTTARFCFLLDKLSMLSALAL
ncbi:hypothetical protein Acr_24g0006580 [Actinidia rufa]|uniref:Uncharacterized protein n=1 Tax=Actinidia rufa TaxID=165716 RepID=A0A7J0GUK6_9ERIC|nr:hypothetical protein Acr_24g0006580 [Actinidia rufa]